MNSTMSSTNASAALLNSLSNAITVHIVYVVLGSLALICNLIVISIFSFNKTLRTKYQMFNGLACTDLVNSSAILAVGIQRLSVIYQALATHLVTIPTLWQCATTTPIISLVAGGQWPACLTMIISIERLLAVYAPFWYRINVTTQRKYAAIVASGVIVLVSVAGGLVNIYVNDREIKTASPICTIPSSFTKAYQGYDCAFIIVGHTSGLIFTIIANQAAKHKLTLSLGNDMANYMRQELKRIRLQIIIISLEVILIAVPQFILWNPFVIVTLGSLAGYSQAIFTFSSCVNLIAYGVTNGEFRAKLVALISCGRLQTKKKDATTMIVVAPMKRASNNSNQVVPAGSF